MVVKFPLFTLNAFQICNSWNLYFGIFHKILARVVKLYVEGSVSVRIQGAFLQFRCQNRKELFNLSLKANLLNALTTRIQVHENNAIKCANDLAARAKVKIKYFE